MSFSHDVKNELRASGADGFLTKAFLTCGSVEDPTKEYHLEFVFTEREQAVKLLAALEENGVSAKLTERKGAHVAYVKNSEAIEDLLTVMGAPMSAIELMNVKIYKDVRNKANRIANCDTANIERTVKASQKQSRDIAYIKETVGLEKLPANLKAIAELRLKNPEATLLELGALAGLGRSGVNHRLMRISHIAEEIRNRGNDRK